MNALAWRFNALAAAKGLMLLLWACTLMAADAGKRDPSTIPGETWILILLTCLVGYLASSAEMLFGWLKDKGYREFGRVVQTFATAIAAGIGAWLALWAADQAPVWCYLAALPASFAGEAYMRRWAEKLDVPVPKEKP